MRNHTTLYQRIELCNLVKYIAALLVVNGHLFLFGCYKGNLVRFMNLGAYCVSVFFFFSSYGLMHSYRAKGHYYLGSFIKKRLTKLLIPLGMAYAVSLPIYAFVKGPIDITTVMVTLFWGGPYLKFSWYVSEAIVLYFLFYLIARNSKDIYRTSLWLTVAVIALMISLFAVKQPAWYIVSLPGFIIGIWYERLEGQLLTHLTTSKAIGLMAVSFVCWFLCWQWHSCLGSYLTSYRYEYASMYLSNILFVIAVTLALTQVRITPPNLRIINSSYEVYLLQNAVMLSVGVLNMTFSEYWVVTMIGVVSIGYIVHTLDKRLFQLFLK